MDPNHDYQDFDMNDAGMMMDLIEYDRQHPNQEIDLGICFDNADHSLQTLPPGDVANNTQPLNDNNLQDLISPKGFDLPGQNGFQAPQPIGPPPLQQQQAVYSSGWYPADGHVPLSIAPMHLQQQQAVYPSGWDPAKGYVPLSIAQQHPQQQQAVFPSNWYASEGFVPSPMEPQAPQQEQAGYPFGGHNSKDCSHLPIGLQTPKRQKVVYPSNDYHPRFGWWRSAQPREEGASFNMEIGWYKVVASTSIRPPSAAPSITPTAIDASDPIDGKMIGESFAPVLTKTQPRVQRQSHNRSISPQSDVSSWKRSIIQDCTCKLKLRQSIPRPKNAFILFRSQHAQAFEAVLKSEGMTTVTHAHISSRAGKQWNKASPEEKAKWRQMAAKEKKEHREKYPDYKYQPKTKHEVRFGSPSCKCGAYEVNMEYNRQTHDAIETDTPETAPEDSQAEKIKQIGPPSMADQDAPMDSDNGSAGDELPADDNPAPVRSKPVRRQAKKRKRNVENQYAGSPRRSKRLTKTKTSYMESLGVDDDDDTIVVATSKPNPKTSYMETSGGDGNDDTIVVATSKPKTSYMETLGGDGDDDTIVVARPKAKARAKTSYMESSRGDDDDDTIVVATSKAKAKPKTSYMETSGGDGNDDTIVVARPKAKAKAKAKAKPKTSYMETSGDDGDDDTIVVARPKAKAKAKAKTKTSYMKTSGGDGDDDTIVVATSKAKAKAKDSKPREQYNIVPPPPSPDHSESDDEDIVIPHRGPPWYLNLPDHPERR